MLSLSCHCERSEAILIIWGKKIASSSRRVGIPRNDTKNNNFEKLHNKVVITLKGKKIMSDFGDKLRFWRKKLDFSQNLLAQKSGVSPVTIGQIETGKRKARKQTIQKLLDGLGITDSHFFGITHEVVAESAPAAVITQESQVISEDMSQPVDRNVPVILSNLDLEIINRVLNLTFDGKISVLKYLQALS